MSNKDNITEIITTLYDTDLETGFRVMKYLAQVCEFKVFSKGETAIVKDFDELLKTLLNVAPSSSDLFKGCLFYGNDFACFQLIRPIITPDGKCYTLNGLNNGDIYRIEK